MMYADRSYFDVDARRREKQRDRQIDSERLKSGEASASELLQKNSLFSGFKPDQIIVAKRRVRMHLA